MKARVDTDAAGSALEALGLRKGEGVRFRRADRARWQPGTVHQLERDGSVRITDTNGAARAVPLGQIQVRAGRRWEDAADRMRRARQLTLSL